MRTKEIKVNVVDVWKIREYMWENKLTKQEFANMCGISTDILRKILKGYINFRISAIFKIARVMKIEVKDLFNH